ncbi:unnamed protein product [Arabis nemorensis]|uniref:RING-type domain-containing protein n=1 Tax=Arabis nemorensis TaxID=586526 RepID=A0A565BQV2_9BRAS|nr:unnamed protein product [Arabis nemorensis]
MDSLRRHDSPKGKRRQRQVLVRIQTEKDKREVLKKGPFYVNGVLIVIKDPDSSDDTIDFTFVRFHATVMGFSPYLYNKFSLSKLKTLMGENCPVLVTDDEEKDLGFFAQELDLKKPLNPGFYIAENKFVQFKYINLGDFCYNCGMIGHKRSRDEFRFPEERDFNATSRTNVYGPWLRYYPKKTSHEMVLKKSVPENQISVLECEKTLSYAQFFIEIEFKEVYVCNPRSARITKPTHKFRFSCSYLDTTDSTSTTSSKAYEVIRREIYENTPFSLSEFEDKPEVIGNLVERMRLMRKNEFSCDDKWLTLKLQINEICKLRLVDYETVLERCRCPKLIESKILDLIKKRVEEKENLICLSIWEDQIRQLIEEVGCTHYTHLLDVSRRANKAIKEAVQMELSSSRCPIRADRSAVSILERYKVLGPDMDRLDPCMICVGEMFLGEEAIVLPCSHVFHSLCIEKWLQVGHKLPTQK